MNDLNNINPSLIGNPSKKQNHKKAQKHLPDFANEMLNFTI